MVPEDALPEANQPHLLRRLAGAADWALTGLVNPVDRSLVVGLGGLSIAADQATVDNWYALKARLGLPSKELLVLLVQEMQQILDRQAGQDPDDDDQIPPKSR